MAEHLIADVLIPGRGEPIERARVVIDGTMISYAGPDAAGPARAPDDTVVETAVVMPGMWDCHVHFAGLRSPNLESLATSHVATMAARSVIDAEAILDAGFTSVRDVGGLGIHLAPAVEEGTLRAPFIHAAGSVLSTTGGHGDIHSFSLDMAHDVCSASSLSLLCDGVPEVLKAVRTNLRLNAKLIKVCASGGVMSEIDHPQHQQFSDEELTAIVQEAARAERIVAAHCHGKAGIMAALRAGCHTIEHGSFLDEEAADRMLEQDAMLVPTRFVIEVLLGQADILPPYVYEKGQMVADAHEQALKLAVAKGVRIAAGCDIFVSGTMYGHNSMEIQYLINAGLTDLEAIEAATANGPDTLGPQAPRSGQLREGYDADVIVFDRNPLDDRSVWGDPDRVTGVWQRGRRVKGGAASG
ncbi:MAG: amidohydrolase family protein [Actinomycetota bacterium]